MSTPLKAIAVTINGIQDYIPTQGAINWGPYTTKTLYDLATSSLYPTGGSFPLTSDVNFGNSFGLISKYFDSNSANIATAGSIRLSNTDLIEWRNAANSGNDTLGVDGSDNLVYNGSIIPVGLNTLADGKIWIGNISNLPVAQTLTGDVTVTDLGVTSIGSQKIVNAQISNSAAIAYSKLNLNGSITNSDIYSSAAIAYSKLAPLNNSIVPVTNGSGVITSSIVTATTLGYLDATSSIQTQLNGKQTTLTIGNLTDVGTDGITVTGGTGAVIGTGTSISQHVADATHAGYLASADWSTFNGKQAAGSYITALTGDVTASGPGSAAATLATVNSNTGSFGSSTSIPSFTVNGKGLITAASGNAVVAPAGTLSGTTLNSTVVTSSLTSVGTITSGTWNGTTIAIAHGGTGVTSVTTTPTASAFAGWDANKNLSANNHLEGYATTATAAGTTTLVVGSAYLQYFTGSSTQTVLLPVTSTLVLGQQFLITNLSSGAVTVQSSGANTLQAMVANTQLIATVTAITGTGTASWSWEYSPLGTTPVAMGGTGDTSLTAYAVLTGGTTSTGAVQSVSGVGTSGQVLTSSGAGALPTWQSVSGNGTVNSGTIGQNAVYTGTNAVSSGLTMSMNNTKITSLANGTAATDAAAFGQLKVLQTVTATFNLSNNSSTSNTFTNTSTTLAITPTSSSNRILIMVSGMLGSASTVIGNQVYATINSSANGNLGNSTYGLTTSTNLISSAVTANFFPCSMTVVDSPASGSAVTYTVQFKADASATVYWGYGIKATITLMEIV